MSFTRTERREQVLIIMIGRPKARNAISRPTAFAETRAAVLQGR